MREAPVHLRDRVAHLALQPIQAHAHPLQLVLEREHALDAGEVEAELGRQPLDQPQPLEVRPDGLRQVPGGRRPGARLPLRSSPSDPLSTPGSS
jgi:hypothetical protein